MKAPVLPFTVIAGGGRPGRKLRHSPHAAKIACKFDELLSLQPSYAEMVESLLTELIWTARNPDAY